MTKEKEKLKLDTLPSQLHFITSTQLEESLSRIVGLRKRHLSVEIADLDEDESRFTLSRRENERMIAQVTGTLRRWQGTQTRVDCDGIVPQHTFVRQFQSQFVMIVITMSLCIAPIMALSIMRNIFLVRLPGMVGLIFIGLVIMGVVYLRRAVERGRVEREYRARREIDKMMGLIAGCFEQVEMTQQAEESYCRADEEPVPLKNMIHPPVG